MITLVWNDVPATQLVSAARETQKLADAAADKEAAQQWARAALAAAAAVDPAECDLSPFQAFADALMAVGDEELVKEAAEALAKHPQALFVLAAGARKKKWEDFANATMAQCLARTGAMSWQADFPYQQQWQQQYEEGLVATLLKVWKKRASRTVAKQAVAFAAEAEGLDAEQVEERLKALLTPADLWTRPVQRGRQSRGRQETAGRPRSSGRRPSTASRSQRTSSRPRTPRKSEGETS